MLDYKINQQHADIAVLELSSYQLEYGVDIAFDVGIVLNVTPDHMDRYRNMQHYADTKAHLVACCKKAVVLNADDAWVRNMAHVVPNNVAIYWFSQHAHDRDGVALTANDHMQMQGCLRDLYADIPLAHNKLLGVHNRDNAMSAFLAMHALGVMHDTATWLRGYQQFTGLPHRLQIVADVDGVCYINDSKATNDAAAAIAVQAMQRPFIWLLGGQDKGSGYQACLQAAAHRPLKTIIAFGAARNIIASACAEFGLSCMVCDTMLEACHAAQQLACANDVVLLSPACASFDEFMNYNHRGQVYTKWAQQQT